jgi:hypothetical protein
VPELAKKWMERGALNYEQKKRIPQKDFTKKLVKDHCYLNYYSLRLKLLANVTFDQNV